MKLKRFNLQLFFMTNFLSFLVVKTFKVVFKFSIMAKYPAKASEKVEKTMHEIKEGELKTGEL